MTGQDGQEGPRSRLQDRIVAAVAGASHGAQGMGEPAAGVGDAPRLVVGEQGRSHLAELAEVGPRPGAPSAHARLPADSPGRPVACGRVGSDVRGVVGGGGSSVHGREDVEMPAKSRDVQHLVQLR